MSIPLTKEEKRRLKGWSKEKEPVVSAPKIQKDSEEQEIVTVLCVRFGNKYGRDYVERLRNMVARHLTMPYDFVCLTDDQTPIPGVRNIVQPNAGYNKGWWHKVHMFDPDLPIRGRILYLDLDVIVHSSINKLFKKSPEKFLGIHDFNRKFHATWHYMNSSVLAWTHGEHRIIFERFQKNPREAMRLHGDQDWIWKLCKDEIEFWPQDWIKSYKWEIRNRDELLIRNYKRTFKDVKDNIPINPDCCIAVFHGDPKPEDIQDKFVVDNWR
jgi:hypothetical protein